MKAHDLVFVAVVLALVVVGVYHYGSRSGDDRLTLAQEGPTAYLANMAAENGFGSVEDYLESEAFQALAPEAKVRLIMGWESVPAITTLNDALIEGGTGPESSGQAAPEEGS